MPVAEAAAGTARDEGIRVAVIPTERTVQGSRPLAVHEPARRFDDDVVAMTAAARATRHGAVTVAAREALTMAGVCQPGDVLGLRRGRLRRSSAHDLTTASASRRSPCLDRLLGAGGELVTLVVGADADPALAPGVVEHLGASTTRRSTSWSTTAASRATRCSSVSSESLGRREALRERVGHRLEPLAHVVGAKTADALAESLGLRDRRRPAAPLPAPLRTSAAS